MRLVRITLVNNSDHLVVAQLRLRPLDRKDNRLEDLILEVPANRHSTAVFCPSPDTLRPAGHRRPGPRKDVDPLVDAVTTLGGGSKVVIHGAQETRALVLKGDLGGDGQSIEDAFIHVARYATRGTVIARIRDAKGVLLPPQEKDLQQ